MKSNHYPVAVIGGGQAGLSISHCLKQKGIDHLVFERNRIAEAWRSQRWDSFCLVTPNWQCRLPGFPYSGPDPEGFMKREEIVGYIEAYVKSFDPPVLESVAVQRLSRDKSGRFALDTSLGEYTADQVVVAVGGYHLPNIPRIAERFSPELVQIHSSDYKNPESLPEGAVLVVGTGQSGCQIAEDIHLTGRKVYLCVGGAPRTARRYRGADVVTWLDRMGYYDKPIHEHPQKERVRAKANHYVTGRDGGRDIDLRKFALQGMSLHGRLKDLRDGILLFENDLKTNLDRADEVSENIKTTIDKFIESQGIQAPIEERYRPVWEPGAAELTLDYQAAGIKSIIWSAGFRPDYRWIDLPVFDGKGYPGHDRGVTREPGLYFLGLPWQFTWGSGRFSGVARDASFLADRIEIRNGADASVSANVLDEWAFGS
jgi:putative flavoprotein involved in K+ transport